ncbi:MAG TPA: anti-sigma factor [Pyrinomonadaceae bacterium]|nr:anti-sigma factor [Pyrinomonadaceae bacterium]
MNEKDRELLLDLLTRQATEGISSAESRQLAALEGSDDDSFDLAAAAVLLSEFEATDELPTHLRAKIVADATEIVGANVVKPEPDTPTAAERRTPIFAWLGWAVAAGAVLALGINLSMTRFGVTEVAQNPPPTATPTPMTPAEAHDKMMTEPGMTVAKWAPTAKTGDMANVSGDVVWSDKQQKGYVMLRGLPKNEPQASTYQLWIFEENQGDKTPIDGGTFNISSDGTVVIPIDAKLAAKNPSMFAVTVEKPGGVVISKREKVAALAKVETSRPPEA